MAFDITLAFDKAEYLDPQIYLFARSIKDKIPKDTTIHIVTNRENDDSPLNYLIDSVNKVMVYHCDEYPDLESRCRYMLNCFKIHPTTDWVIKMELDFMFLKHLEAFNELLNTDKDILMEPENRKIFTDAEEQRLWRIMYKQMGVKCPEERIQFREKGEWGLPLLGTGLICVRSTLIDDINKRWEPMTRIVEPWGAFNVHPNEQAFTAMILDEGWKWDIYPQKYKFNPISTFRNGDFPSTDLVDNAVLPKDTVILDYHHLKWLSHMAKFNPEVARQLMAEVDFTYDSTCKSKEGF
jgi:hypothetical protein